MELVYSNERMAQWIQVRFLFCSCGFESRAHHLRSIISDNSRSESLFKIKMKLKEKRLGLAQLKENHWFEVNFNKVVPTRPKMQSKKGRSLVIQKKVTAPYGNSSSRQYPYAKQSPHSKENISSSQSDKRQKTFRVVNPLCHIFLQD